MKTLEHKQLLEYLKHAINLETAILTQKRIIAEYEESSLKRKPELREKALPGPPTRERVIRDEKGSLAVGIMGGGISLIGIALLVLLFSGFTYGDGLMIVIGGLGSFGCFWFVAKLIAETISSNKEDGKKEAEYSRKYEEQLAEYKKERAEVEEYNKNSKKEYQNNLADWNTSDIQARDYLSAPLAETEETLKTLYALDVVYPKYHNLPALTSIYEYLITGRCEELAGAHGAYNLYEDEVRKDTVISQLNTVIENLEQIKQNQYMLYEQVVGIQQATRAIAVELYQIKGYTACLTELTALNTYYSGIAAANSTALAYCRSL